MVVKFVKMNAIGNDFVIVDVRKSAQDVARGASVQDFSSTQIQKICNRKNIGCDQFILIKESSKANCFMEIYNFDGSQVEACGNATRCVAAIVMDEVGEDEIVVETKAGLLPCRKVDDEIAVEMTCPKFGADFHFQDVRFFCVDVGNPHAVSFANYIPSDEEFFAIAPQIESHQFFPKKTNVEFAKISSNGSIEVRVFERGVGETDACGSGACAVAALAIKNKLVDKNEIVVRFRGGDLKISWEKEGAPIVMQGGYKTIFIGEIDEAFL